MVALAEAFRAGSLAAPSDPQLAIRHCIDCVIDILFPGEIAYPFCGLCSL